MKPFKLVWSPWLRCLFILHSSFCLHAQNTTFTYQGRVQDTGTNYTGTGQFLFALVTTSAGTTTTLWSNDGTTGAGQFPAATLGLSVTNGLFTITLGSPSVPGMAALPAAVFDQAGVQLEIWFSDGVNGTNAFPLQTLTSAPYATVAGSANALNGSLPLAQLPAAVVTNGASGVTLAGSFSGNGSGLTGITIANGNGMISLAQLPAGTVTNMATGVTLNNFTVTGSLSLPGTAAIYSGGSLLLHDDSGANFFAGKQAGYANTLGSFNSGFGNAALAANTTGSDNTANGYGALSANTTGSNNLAAGFNALPVNTTGNYNTAQGGQSLYSNTSGNYNTALGFDAMKSNSVGSTLVAVGYQAMENGTNLNDSTAVGYQALKFSIIDGTGFGDENTAVGSQALEFTTSGEQNTAMGMQALLANTEGYQNTAIGVQALQANTTGGANTAIGMQALQSNTINGGNTAIGYGALQALSLGNNNIALGIQAGQNLPTGSYNIYIGNWGNYSEENGIIRIGTPGTQTATYLAGNVYASGNIYANGSVELTSDRNAKENFAPVDNQAVLARVAALPLTQWNYKTDPKNVRHLGPMAQDFQAAFGLDGSDNKHISVVDEGGVALAAIQGLNQKLQEQMREKDAAIQTLSRQNEALAAQLQQLTATVNALAEKK